jgi:GGDEF domain-containing protein
MRVIVLAMGRSTSEAITASRLSCTACLFTLCLIGVIAFIDWMTGEEISLSMPETDEAEACDTLERIRLALREKMARDSWSITMSTGVVRLTAPREDPALAMEAADRLI